MSEISYCWWVLFSTPCCPFLRPHLKGGVRFPRENCVYRTHREEGAHDGHRPYYGGRQGRRYRRYRCSSPQSPSREIMVELLMSCGVLMLLWIHLIHYSKVVRLLLHSAVRTTWKICFAVVVTRSSYPTALSMLVGTDSPPLPPPSPRCARNVLLGVADMLVFLTPFTRNMLLFLYGITDEVAKYFTWAAVIRLHFLLFVVNVPIAWTVR